MLKFWVKDYNDAGLARTEVLERVHDRLRQEGIEMPTTAAVTRGARAGELQARR
jgi:hypothetical protein